MLEELRERITVLTAKYFLEGYSGKKVYQRREERNTLYLFSRDCRAAGMAHWTGHILVNELLFKEENSELLEYIYLHEKDHQESFLGLSLVTGTSQFFLSPLMMLLHIGILSISIAVSSGNIQTSILSPNTAYTAAITELTIVISSVLFSYVGEMKAELYAMKKLGEESFVERYQRLEELLPRKNMLQQISFRLTHPMPELVVNIGRKLDI